MSYFKNFIKDRKKILEQLFIKKENWDRNFKSILEIILISSVSIMCLYTFSLKDIVFYYKLLILIFTLLIMANSIFYTKFNKILRKSDIKKISTYIGTITIGLLFLNFKYIDIVAVHFAKDLNYIFNTDEKILRIYNWILFGYFVVLICFVFFRDKIFRDKKEDIGKNDDNFLFSFREKELKKLEELIKNKGISNILINAKIGNGKTKLLEEYISQKKPEVIYFKTPLIKDLDELNNNLFKEMKEIFIRYDIENNYLNDFIKEISSIKTNFFEIGINKKTNNWINIQKLKKGLEKFKQNIIIVLDDIEREKNIAKIEDFILFLGEISEYFRNTCVTVLFLANYEYIKEKCFKNNNEFLDKYIRYEFKLKEPTVLELNEQDIKRLFKEAIKNTNKEFSNDNEYINYTVQVITYFLGETNQISKSNENFRRLVKAVNKIIYYRKISKINIVSYSILIFFILSDVFDIRTKDNLGIFNKLLENIGIKLDCFYIFSEINNIEKIYLSSDIDVYNIELNIDKIRNVLSGKEEEILYNDTIEIIVSSCIGKDKEKLRIALEKDLIRTKSRLTEKLLEIDNIEFEESILDKIKKIYLRRELTDLEIKEEREAEEREMWYDEDCKAEYEVILKSINKKIIEKLKKVKSFQNDIGTIEEILLDDFKEKVREEKEIQKVSKRDIRPYV